MPTRALEAIAETPSRCLFQPVVEHRPQASDTYGLPEPQSHPLLQATGRIGSVVSARAHASLLRRASASHPSHTQYSLLQLQQAYGNRYVQRVVTLARQTDGEAEVAPAVEESIQRARGTGQTLGSEVRTRMESAFSADFKGVRVHTDTEADALNRGLNARAFTTGQDIFFRQGEYNPGSSSGLELLAHELTHVVQQKGGLRSKLTISQPKDVYEQEADQVARAVLQQEQHVKSEKADEEQVQRDIDVGIVEIPSELTVPEATVSDLLDYRLITQKAILENQRTALENFRDVIMFASAKESIPKGVGEIALDALNKFVIGKILGIGLKNYPLTKEVIDTGKSITEAVEAEKQKAAEANVSRALGQFIIAQRTAISQLIPQLEKQNISIKRDAMSEYNKMDSTEKKSYMNNLVLVNSVLNDMQYTSHSAKALFQLIVERWVGGVPTGVTAGHVLIRLNKDWKVTTAHIHAPRGQRLAEQLLQNGGGKVNLNDLKLPRKFEFAPEALAFVNAEWDADGKLVGDVSTNFLGQKYVDQFRENIRKRGLPETTVMTGT